MTKIFGYFDDETQTEPAFDPGLNVLCPFCDKPLSHPMVTTSLMVPDDVRSYFYRAHKPCVDEAEPERVTAVDSLIIDAVYAARSAS